MEATTEIATNTNSLGITYDGTVHTISGKLSTESELETILKAKEFYIIGILLIIGIIILLLISINAHIKTSKELLKEIREQNDMSQNILIDILEEVGKNNTKQSDQQAPNWQFYQQQQQSYNTNQQRPQQ